MTGLVLLREGLDVGLDLEPDPSGQARHRGGARIVVASRADRCALEWALGATDRVIALTVGPPAAAGVLGVALARGAARAVRIWDEGLAEADLAATSRVLAAAVRALAPDLVVAGERGLEGATGMLPALVAARLGWPCLEGALRVAREPAGVVAERRLGGGRREEVAVEWPAVVTVTADSTEPRYVSVFARRHAAAAEVWDLGRLGLTAAAVRAWTRLRVERVDWPRPRAKRTPGAAPPRSAADRMRQLMAGGRAAVPPPGGPGAAAGAEPAAGVIEGEPAQLAERILAFLESRGLL